MNFQVRRAGNFFQVETGLMETFERVERAALQQFGQRAFERNFKARMRAETGKATLITWVQQGHIHDRVAPAQ